MTEKKKNNYPREVFAAKTSSQTLSVEGHLTPIDTEKVGSPYKIYDEKFSRFIFAIIGSQNGVSHNSKANLRVKEVFGVIEASRSAMNAETMLALPFAKQMYQLQKATATVIDNVLFGTRCITAMMLGKPMPQKKAATQVGKLASGKTFQIGNLKGKTPLEVIKEEGGMNTLVKQREFLAKNLEKFPANRELIAAIDEAIFMAQNNLLDAAVEVAPEELQLGVTTIFSSGPRPLIHGDNAQEYCPVNELDITWTIGNRYPVEIRVQSYKAKVVRTNAGTLNVMRSDKRDECENRFKLSAASWFECLHNMETHMRRFEDMLAAKQFQIADDLDRQNRMEAKLQKEQSAKQTAAPVYQQPMQQPYQQQVQQAYQQPQTQVAPQPQYQQPMMQSAMPYAPVQQPMYQQVPTPANYQDIPMDAYYPVDITMEDF